jgi:hypothetical protein
VGLSHSSLICQVVAIEKGPNLGVKNRFCGGGPIALHGIPVALGWLLR